MTVAWFTIIEVYSGEDIGVVIDNKLNFPGHLGEKINKTNRIVGLIRRTFVSLDEEIFKSLYVTPRTSKLVPTLTCEERLRKLRLPTVAYRERHDRNTQKTVCYDPQDQSRGHHKKIFQEDHDKQEERTCSVTEQ
ncbi:hypothetical protein Hamer_G026996, partial [Homarus americanus]